MVRAQSITATLVYTYNHSGLRVAQSVPSGKSVAYAWDWVTGVPELLSDGDTLYLVGHETLGQYAGGAWAYYLPDALGSVRQATDGAGAVVSAREWSPYGVELGGAQPGLGYTGEWWDAAVGLQYLRARWYAPGEGRFTAPDPFSGLLSWPQSQNPYPYAANNPVLQADPSGEFCIPCVIAAAIGLAVFLEGCALEPTRTEYADAEAFVETWAGKQRDGYSCFDTAFYVSYLVNRQAFDDAGLSLTDSKDIVEPEPDDYLKIEVQHPAEKVRDERGYVQISAPAERGNIVFFYWSPDPDRGLRTKALFHAAVVWKVEGPDLFEKIGIARPYQTTLLDAVINRITTGFNEPPYDEDRLEIEYWAAPY